MERGEGQMGNVGHSMEEAIRAFVAINFFVIGVSHIVQHRAWGEFFDLLRRQGRPGAFANGFLSLLTGSLIVSFHNVWTGIPTLLTVLGWAMLVKAFFVFTIPNWGLRSMAQVDAKSSRKIIVPGVAMVIVSVLLVFTLLGE